MPVLVAVAVACTLAPTLAAPPPATPVFVQGESAYACIKVPSLISLASGVLVAFAEGRQGACFDWFDTQLVMKRSTDGGATWGPLTVVYAAPHVAANVSIIVGNAAPVQLSSGRILLPFCVDNLAVWLGHSDDDGATWSLPVRLENVTLPSWTWVGTGPPASLLLPSGRVVVPSYHSKTPHDDAWYSSAHVMVSDDAGATWRLGGGWSDGWDQGLQFPNENQIVTLGEPPALLSFARGLLTSRLVAMSLDGGDTWSNASIIPDLPQPLGGCEGSTVLHAPSASLLFSGPATTSPFRFNLTLWRRGTAGAATAPWTPVATIDAGPSSYSSLAVLPSGAVGVLFEASNVTTFIFEPQVISFAVVHL